MKRAILALLAGLLAWALIVSLLNRGLRAGLPGYAQAEPTLHFSVGMMWARLAIAAVTSLLAGAVARALAPAARYTPWILGTVVLAAFVPAHVSLWKAFPVWYHLTFLVPLVPLVVLGARLVPARTDSPRRPV